LPDRLPDVPGLALAARYLPGAAGTEVGGDWYDVIPLADGRVGIAMGDVVGRGIPAASLMGQLRNGLRAYAIEGHPPAAVLERLDRLVQSLNPGRMATLLYMVIEPDGRNAVFSNAGHLPPLVVNPDGSVAELAAWKGDLLLGVDPDTRRRESVVTLDRGATVLLYTDGLVERRDADLDTGLVRLRDALVELAHLPLEDLLDGARGVPVGVLPYASFEEAGARLEPGSTLVLYTDGLVEERGISIEIRLEELQRVASEPFDGPNELCERLLRDLLPEGPGQDDVAVLALTTAPASTDRLALTLPAEPEALITARRALRNWLAEVGVEPEALYDITLATGEACTNAIEHAYAPGEASFDLEALRSADDVLVRVRDYGSWREPRGQNRGRGLKLMRTLMDDVNVRREPTGTTVELRRVVKPDGDAG
jgi:serine phosphatase RsbU (regulator of sigma subunit)/anti-sigma regulatory factor (Ser/Thr protein kinase)